MTNNRRVNPKPFVPTKGEVYENVAAGKYLCESSYQDADGRSIAWMVNIKTGWSLTAKGIVRYEDGSIEWDYSTDGCFVTLDDRRQEMIDRAIQREIDRKVTRAAMKNKQNSILNAMLCCLI